MQNYNSDQIRVRIDYKYGTDFEYDFQIQISEIPRTVTPSRFLPADEEAVETGIVW